MISVVIRVSVLARKITRAKWELAEGLQAGEISADAISIDLRTTGNSLSFWHCSTATDEELRKTVLALATAADRVDRMDVAWIAVPAIEAEELCQIRTEGETPVASLRDRHVDLAKLDMIRLGKVARLIAAALTQNQHRRMSKKEVVEIIVEAVHQRLVDLADLKEKVREEVEKELSRSSKSQG